MATSISERNLEKSHPVRQGLRLRGQQRVATFIFVALKQTLKTLETNGKNALRTVLAPRAIVAFRQAASGVSTIEDAVTLAADWRYYRIKITPSQIRSEILDLLRLLSTRPPKTLMEIGTDKGGTLFLFSRVATPDALLISLDLPPGRPGWGYPPWRKEVFLSFARERQKIELVLADSHLPATVDLIGKVLGGRSLDFLLIDGDHSYEGVKLDFEMYAPLVAPGGLIAFHDIVPRRPEPFGVPQFWQELKKIRPVTEFVADWNQSGYGIGLVKNDRA
jgi:predicted O-methyltransferase YrrM